MIDATAIALFILAVIVAGLWLSLIEMVGDEW